MLSVKCKKAIRHCILKAYPDIQFRTLKGLGIIPAEKKNEAKQRILDFLTNVLHDYFVCGITQSFDSWHKDVCNKVSGIFEEDTGIPLPFGKAQKLVNISFKYMYCLDDAEKYLSKFVSCHMALDSIVLQWYRKNIDGKHGINHWSSINYSDYKEIQTNIRGYCMTKGTYPILEEFDIWLSGVN